MIGHFIWFAVIVICFGAMSTYCENMRATVLVSCPNVRHFLRMYRFYRKYLGHNEFDDDTAKTNMACLDVLRNYVTE